MHKISLIVDNMEVAELKEEKWHLGRKILYFTNFHVLWNLEKIIFLWVSFKFPVMSEIFKYMHLTPKGALKWSLEMKSSWGSLCNNATTIQTPETVQWQQEKQSTCLLTILSDNTLYVTFNPEPSQPVFLIYRECPLQNIKEEPSYILKTVLLFYWRWW